MMRRMLGLKYRIERMLASVWRGPQGKLTPEKVRIILADSRSNEELAAIWGVHADTVDNVRRGVTWRSVSGITERLYKPRLLRYGEDSNRSKLDVDAARAIYRDERPTKEIAKVFGVSIGTVRNIKRGQRWRHATIGLPRAPRQKIGRPRKNLDRGDVNDERN